MGQTDSLPHCEEAVSIKQTVGEIIAEKVGDLPALPTTVSRVLQLTQNPNVSMQALEREILQDAALTGSVLKLANSAYYGLPRKVPTVGAALVYLGIKAVRSLVLTSSVLDLFGIGSRLTASVRQTLWRGSVYAATAAKAVAQKAKYPDPEIAFVAGLLHDIGKVVLLHYMNEHYLMVIDLLNESPLPAIVMEHEVCGTDHTEVGRLVCEKWQLPEVIVEAVACHHQPERAARDPRLTAIVYVGNLLAWMLAAEVGQTDSLPHFVVDERKPRFATLWDALGQIGLKRDDLEPLSQATAEAARSMLAIMVPQAA